MPQSVFKAGFLRTPHFSRRPEPPWAMNLDSMQADGLVAWYPLGAVVGDEPNLSLALPGNMVNNGSTLEASAEGGVVRKFAAASSQYLRVGTPIIITTPLTIAAWVFPVVTNTQMAIADITDTGGDTHFFMLKILGTTNKMVVQVQSAAGSNSVSSVADVVINQWNHGCGVFTSSTSRDVYLDGIGPVNGAADLTPAGLDATDIGRLGRLTPSLYFDGNISDVRFYNRALRAAEVWQLYDPSTSWDLYYPLRRRIFSFPSEEAAAVAPKRLLLLGVG